MNFKQLLSVTLFAFAICAAPACTDDSSLGDLVTGGSSSSTEPEEVEPLVTYTWPTDEGQANLSEHYRVFVSVGDADEIEVEVIQSDPIVEKLNLDGSYGEDYQATYTKQRTFSFVNVSYDESSGETLKFRVQSLSASSSDVRLAPASYGITATSTGNEAKFEVDKANRYISINFYCDDNIVDYSVSGPNGTTNHYDWVKNMLMIYVDPLEEAISNFNYKNVVYFSETTTNEQLEAADIVYFKPGYYNLANYPLTTGSEPVPGALTMEDGQHIYIAGGAFVEGYVLRTAYGDTNQKMSGRGILTGRQYTWQPGDSDRLISQLVNAGSSATFEGLMFMESPHHGIVPTSDALFENVKFLGWHCNNDGLRPGNNSIIRNCFIRAYDDAFYNYCLDVSDCVLWPGFNGSIMTYGWQSIDIGGSVFENIDIIEPEWKSMGNNCGVVMSQNTYAFNPVNDYTVFRNLNIEGQIPGFVNLKPNSYYGTGDTDEKYDPVATEADLGWLGDLIMENVTVNAQIGQSTNGLACNLIEGATGSGIVEGMDDATWWTKDITFTNLYINGEKITDANKATYFTIDEATTKNIVFE